MKHTNEYVILLLVYMDDIILTWSSSAPLASLISSLQQEFVIKDLDILHYLFYIEALSMSNGLLLTQNKYIHDLLQWSHMDGAQSMKIPVGSDSKLLTYDDD